VYLGWRGMSAMALLAGVLCWTGCGVKSTASGPPIEQPPGNGGSNTTTPILLTLTDDTTSNGLVSFYANISQVQITPRSGTGSTLYASTNTFELTHLAGTTQYLTMAGLPQDSYKNIVVSVTDPLITYIDSTGATVTQEFPTFAGTAEIDFTDLLTVDTTPLEITLDFNLEKSVALDPVAGTLTLTPTFTATALPIAAASPNIGTGLLESVLGTVSNYTGSVLTVNTTAVNINLLQAAMTCNITPATTTVNYSASAGLPKGALVRLDMDAERDSSIHCARIEAVNPSSVGYAMAGTINSYRGLLAPYQMTLAMQEGSGAGVSPLFLGRGINVNFDATATFPAAAFAIDWDGMDKTNLGFTPLFTPATFFPSQYLEASSAVPLLTTGNDVGAIPGSMVTVAAMNAAQITLRKQNEEGTVSNVITDSGGVIRFLLTLPTSTVFARYTALPVEPTGFVPTITVVVPASVIVSGSLTSTITGAPAASLPYVKVRGLLFLTGATYTLVAQRVTATLPPPPPVTVPPS
jgi:hypothetical protein